MNSEQYAEEIKHTRGNIDETLHNLEGKISPRELWDQAIKWSGGARDFSNNLGRMVRENPIPSTLMGISLLWFMAAGSGRQVENVDVSGMKSRLQGKYSEARHKYAEMKSSVTGTASETGERMKTFTSDLKHRGEHLREQGAQWKERLQTRGSELSGRPVLLSALGLAVGALFAMSLPVSRREEEMMGEAGREMYRRTSEAVGEELDRGKRAASAAAEAARETYREEEHPGTGREWSGATPKSPDDFRESTH